MREKSKELAERLIARATDIYWNEKNPYTAPELRDLSRQVKALARALAEELTERGCP